MAEQMSKGVSRRLYQRQIPLILVSALITIIVVQYFVPPYAPLTAAKDELGLWGSIIYTFVLLFGYIALIMSNVRRVMDPNRSRRTYLSVLWLGALAAYIVLGLVLQGGSTGSQYKMLYMYIALYAGAGMNASWIIHSYNSYRYLRFSSVATSLFLLAFVFVVCRELSVMVAVYPPLYDIGSWIEQVVNGPAQSASLACAGVGTLILATRALVGKEPGLIEMEVT
jgi:hypothetical protein